MSWVKTSWIYSRRGGLAAVLPEGHVEAGVSIASSGDQGGRGHVLLRDGGNCAGQLCRCKVNSLKKSENPPGQPDTLVSTACLFFVAQTYCYSNG